MRWNKKYVLEIFFMDFEDKNLHGKLNKKFSLCKKKKV
jgi:hypothetical protein